MASHGSGDGADPADDALQQVGQGLGEAVRRLEQKLLEKEAIPAQQPQLPETREREIGVEVVASDGSAGEGAEQRLVEGVKKVETPLQTSMEGSSPSVSLQQLEQPISRDESQSSTSSAASSISISISPSAASDSGAPETEEEAAAGGAEASPTEALLRLALLSTSSSGAGHQGPAAEEERRVRERVERRMREVDLKAEQACASPCPLGEQLCHEAENGTTITVESLLNKGANVNYIGRAGRTPLHHSLYYPAKLDVMRLLLQRGADVDAVTPAGNSALQFAALNDTTGRCVELLVNAGSDLNSRDKVGGTALHWAVSNKNIVAVRALLAAGARKDLKPWAGIRQNITVVEMPEFSEIKNLL